MATSDIKFNYFMGTLLRERKADLYRSKGVLSIHGQGNTKFVFQGVHESINFGPAAEDWKDDEPRVNTSNNRYSGRPPSSPPAPPDATVTLRRCAWTKASNPVGFDTYSLRLMPDILY